MVQNNPQNDVYLQWRARLAAKQEARRQQYDPPAEPTPAPPPAWDAAQLFERDEKPAVHAHQIEADPAPAAPEVIDLRQPAEPTTTAAPSVTLPTEPPRRQALLERYTRRARGLAPLAPSVAEQIRELNEQRLAGTIDEHEFKARKAELFNPSR